MKNTVIFNYSNIILTKPMENLLNRGLNFSILPMKLDITEVLTDYKKFERKIWWHEFWFNRENEEPQEEKIFKTDKTNFPKGHQIPQHLKVFLSSVKSEMMDPRNRNQEKCNLPVEELEALKQLIHLQRERKLVVKACDKGSGIILLDFDRYLKSCYEHLLSQEEGTGKYYYKEVPQIQIEVSKKEILEALKEALEKDMITKEEFKAMDPTDKDVARFYCNYKVHKEHKEGELPPVRPIISANNCITEGIATYVANKIKQVAKQHDTYVEDTPDFLRAIDKVSDLKENTILASIDVKALFTNIPKKDGLESLEAALEGDTNKELVVKFMKLILNNNLFVFHDGIYRQDIGGAMGSSPMPPYADNFMAKKIDDQIKNIATQFTGEALKLLKRFLDDLFLIFQGTTKQLHTLLSKINEIHPSIKFTMTHTSPKSEKTQDKCTCKPLTSIPFLDTQCSIEGGKIEVDLYRKETDKNQYLLLNSCHPKSVTKNIPFSLSLRIVRICTKYEDRVKRLNELKQLLKERGYPDRIIDPSIKRALKIPRSEAIKKVKREDKQKRPVLALKYDPRMPPVPNIINKHWRAMICQDQYLKQVFEAPPLVAYKKQKKH